MGNGTSAVNLKTPAEVLADILPATTEDAGKVPTVQEDGTIALAEVSGGGVSLVVEETLLASGTIAAETAGQTITDTGLTVADLQKWKYFSVCFKSTGQSTYWSICYLNTDDARMHLFRTNHNSIMAMMWWVDDAERTTLLGSYKTGTGYEAAAATIGNTMELAYNYYGDTSARLTQIKNLNSKIYIQNYDALTVDATWEIRGLIKYGS